MAARVLCISLLSSPVKMVETCLRTSVMSFIRPRVSVVSLVSSLLHLIITMSWSVTLINGHGCSILTKYGKLTADCDNMELKSIPRDLDYDIKILMFRDNHLTSLAMDEFTMYRALQELWLIRNKIEQIAPDAFRNLHNLQKLDLEGNKIQDIPPAVFQHLTSVRKLNMKDNPLMVITRDALSNLKNIEELNFENCWLERIHPQAFRGLNRLENLNLVNNELQVLDAGMERYLPISLKVMRLYSNPWNCDCKLRWLREYVKSHNIQWYFYKNEPVCNLPELIHDISWNNLHADKFACAAQIMLIRNLSTSILLEVHGNITINCIVQGDPEPEITWMTGSMYVPTEKIMQKSCLSEDGTKQICSSLIFNDLALSDEGDYRCIAKNSAGRSEITYKLWVNDPLGVGTSTTLYGLTMETLIGIGIGALVLILLVVACIIWMVRKQNGSRRPVSQVSDYKKPACTNHENHSPPKQDKEYHEVEEETRPVISEINDKDRTTHISVNCELVPINQKPSEAASVSSPVRENHLNATKNNDFKMTIFKPEQKKDDKSNLDNTVTVIAADTATDSTETTPLCNNKSSKTAKKTEPVVVDPGIIPPDVVQRADDRTLSHRTPPIVVTPTSNHVQCTGHKRAEENPYAKPSDMKHTKQKKTGSKPNTNKPQDEPKHKTDNVAGPRVPASDSGNSHSKTTKDDIHSPTTPGEGNKKKVTTFSIEPPSPSCMNPVCLKDHVSGGSPSRSKSPTKSKDITDKDLPPALTAKQHIKGSKSMGGLSNSPERGNHIGAVSPTVNKKVASAADRYKTLPNRPKITIQTDDPQLYGVYARGRNLPSHDDYSIPSSRVSHGHYDVPRPNPEHARPIKTATIATAPRQLPPAARGPQHHEPQIHGFQPSLPMGPIPAHLRSKTLGPSPRSRTSTDSHGDRANSSPTRKLPKAFEATSLDDLLSPPFGHITVDKQKTSPRAQVHKLPKPGENDEYGTAV